MSAIDATTPRRKPVDLLDTAADEYELPDMPIAPREGWISIIALSIMLVVVAVAIDDAGWAGFAIGTRISQTGFLPLAALVSTLLGAYLSKTNLSTTRIHLIGSAVGGLALLYFVSSAISRFPSVDGRLHELNLSVATFANDVFVLGTRSSETSVFLLLLGALIWGAGHFCAVAVFRRRRPRPAVLLSGAIVLLNVSLTIREQYIHLLIFVAAALALAVRLNVLVQAREWRSRGMRDVAEISASFLRSGAVFVTVAIVASTMLAANASSAPLARAWSDWDDDILNFGYSINRWLGGVTGSARGPNVLFTPTQTIRDFWQSSSDEVFTARVSDGAGRLWRGATYDSFDGHSWLQLDRQVQIVDTGDELLANSRDSVPAGPGRTAVTVEVLPIDYGGDVFVAPAAPLEASGPVELMTRGTQGPFVSARMSYGITTGVPYTVRSLARATNGEGVLTASQLAAAGADYPAWVRPYLDIRPDSIGAIVQSTAQSIRDALPRSQRDPYHVALAVQDYLYAGGGFTYTTDVRGECDRGDTVADCFLRIKKGYCEYFATSMTMMLRTLGIPARYVVGYLPGKEQDDGTWRVERSAAHSWVEVYFPDYGWIEFDPTPGNSENGQAPTSLSPGDPLPSSDPGEPVGPIETPDECFLHPLACGPLQDSPVPPPSSGAPPPPSGPLMLLLISGALALAVVLAVWVFLRRVPSTQPELAYNAITRLATRLGHGPRPAQTAFEYAARLGELVPVARADLHLLARAKVEVTYGHRQAGTALKLRIGVAYRRVRLGLLRLLFRLPKLGRDPRAPRGTRVRRRP